jgi:hypothetical protein
MAHALISKTLCGVIEPAVRTVADRIFMLTGGRAGSRIHKPTIASFYETGLVFAIYEFLLMSPDLAHLEIRHENPYPGITRPEQVDLWIRPPTGGYAHLVEAGDFAPGKVKQDAAKMRRLNPKGTNWFLAFFRKSPDSGDPWTKLQQCRRRKGSLKFARLEYDQRMTGSFTIRIPSMDDVQFGYALIRVKQIRRSRAGPGRRGAGRIGEGER